MRTVYHRWFSLYRYFYVKYSDALHYLVPPTVIIAAKTQHVLHWEKDRLHSLRISLVRISLGSLFPRKYCFVERESRKNFSDNDVSIYTNIWLYVIFHTYSHKLRALPFTYLYSCMLSWKIYINFTVSLMNINKLI